jgi:hypothetical protein
VVPKNHLFELFEKKKKLAHHQNFISSGSGCKQEEVAVVALKGDQSVHRSAEGAKNARSSSLHPSASKS